MSPEGVDGLHVQRCAPADKAFVTMTNSSTRVVSFPSMKVHAFLSSLSKKNIFFLKQRLIQKSLFSEEQIKTEGKSILH